MNETSLSYLAIAVSLISAIVAALSYRASQAAGREAYAGARTALGWSVRAKQIIAAPHRPWSPSVLSGSAYDMREELRRHLRDLGARDRARGAELLTVTVRFLDEIFEWREDETTPIQQIPKANDIYLRWVHDMNELLSRLEPQREEGRR
jgi:hypothetical protein